MKTDGNSVLGMLWRFSGRLSGITLWIDISQVEKDLEIIEDDEEKLNMFRNEVGTAVLYDYIQYALDNEEEDIAEWKIIIIARVDT